MAFEESCTAQSNQGVKMVTALSHKHTLRPEILDTLRSVSLSCIAGQEGIFPFRESGSWVSDSKA